MFLPIKNILGVTSFILFGIKKAKSEFLWVESLEHPLKRRVAIDFQDDCDKDEKNVLFSGWEEVEEDLPRVEGKWGCGHLGAHLTLHLMCLHLVFPGFDRLLLTSSHIPRLHLISYLPSLKSLWWEDDRESKMIEVTGPVAQWRTVRKRCQELFSTWKGTPFCAL